MIDLKEVFQGATVPRWLLRFQEEPLAALEDLLVGAGDLGPLAADEPSGVLLDWLDGLGQRTEFPKEVDAALAQWIDRSWGNPMLPGAASSATLTAVAWCRAGDVIAMDERLDRAAGQLRIHVLENRFFLDALTEGRSRDPQGRAWLALARHQRDRGLVDDWWRLCRLPPEEPWYRGECGIEGLSGLPAIPGSEHEGGFPAEAAEGLAILGVALAERMAEGYLGRDVAQEEFVRTARLTMAAYPFEDHWGSFWRHTFKRPGPKPPRDWVEKLVSLRLPKRTPQPQRRRPAPVWARPDRGWREQAERIAARLRQGDTTAVSEAESLLATEVAYAEGTGNPYDAVRSACTFAKAVRRHRPDLSMKWGDLARTVDPRNAYAWTSSVSAYLAAGRIAAALPLALKTIARFPNDAVARNGLAQVLKAQDRLEEAEDVYREAVRRFPRDEVAKTGLERVLKARGKSEEIAAPERQAPAVPAPKEPIHEPPRPAAVTPEGPAKAELGPAEPDHVDEAAEEPKEAAPAELRAREPEGLRLAPEQPKAPAPVDQAPGESHALQQAPERPKEAAPTERAPREPEAVEEVPREQRQFAGPDAVVWPYLTRVEEQHAQEVVEEAKEPAPVERGLRAEDVSILLTDVYLLRRWGRKAGLRRGGPTAGALRDEARRLLERLVEPGRQDARAAGEAGLLWLEEGDLEHALELLREAVRRFPGSVRVRYALARAERERAGREKLKAVPENEQAVVVPWKRLVKLEQQCKPVGLLGEGRAWLALSDGAHVEHEARNAFGGLAHWVTGRIGVEIHRPAPPGLFRGEDDEESQGEGLPMSQWWAWEVREHLFGGEPVQDADGLGDLTGIRLRVDEKGDLLNRLEEELVLSLGRA